MSMPNSATRGTLEKIRSALKKLRIPDFSKYCEILNIESLDSRKRVVTLMTCYNQYSYTRQGVNSYFGSLDANYQYILVLLDDSSTDETKEWVAREGPTFKNFAYVRFKKNRGLTRSWNYGVDYAIRELNADYVVIANDDILLPKGSIGKLIRNLETIGQTAIIGPLTNCPGFNAKSQDIRLYLNTYEPSDVIEDIERVDSLIERNKVIDVTELEKDIAHEINGFLWAGQRKAFLMNTYRRTLGRNYYFDPNNIHYGNEREFQQRIVAREIPIRICIASNVFIFHYKDISLKTWEGRSDKPSLGYELFRP
jgi:GT2 family glycosyltransferase